MVCIKLQSLCPEGAPIQNIPLEHLIFPANLMRLLNFLLRKFASRLLLHARMQTRPSVWIAFLVTEGGGNLGGFY